VLTVASNPGLLCVGSCPDVQEGGDRLMDAHVDGLGTARYRDIGHSIRTTIRPARCGRTTTPSSQGFKFYGFSARRRGSRTT